MIVDKYKRTGKQLKGQKVKDVGVGAQYWKYW